MEPGAFWARESYELSVTDWSSWEKSMLTGIGKCPSVSCLVKLQKDNAVNINEYGKVYSAAAKDILQAITDRWAALLKVQK